jgi:hypothetical protein
VPIVENQRAKAEKVFFLLSLYVHLLTLLIRPLFVCFVTVIK